MAQSKGFTSVNTVGRMEQFQAQRMDIIANTPCVLAELASSEEGDSVLSQPNQRGSLMRRVGSG